MMRELKAFPFSNTPQGGISVLQIIFLFFISENNLQGTKDYRDANGRT